MKATQRLIPIMIFFAVSLLFTAYGCKTTNNAITSEQAVSESTSDKTEYDVIRPVAKTGERKKVKTTEAIAREKTKKDKEHIEQFTKRFFGMIGAHGGVPLNGPKGELTKKPIDNFAVKPDTEDERPFIMLEKKLYGTWINKKETESYDFHDDGKVIITVTGQRGRMFRLHGNYKLLEEERIKIDFRGDPKVDQLPPRYFKISISDNEFALTDEPEKSDGQYGSTTKYHRVYK